MGDSSKPEPGADDSAAGQPPVRIRAETCIADAIAANPAALDRLIALSPVFQQLRDAEFLQQNGRMFTLSDAATITGVALDDLLTAVNVATPEACVADPSLRQPTDETPPAWLARFDRKAAPQIDVRPLIAANREPFTQVMALAATVGDGGNLLIEAPFNPLPLRRVLQGKGLASFAERVADDHWRIYCRREPTASEELPTAAGRIDAPVWRTDDGLHIDVRGLEPPGPLVAILSLIDGLETDDVLTVHHKRDPLFLYPELAERSWSWERVAGEPREVRLVLRRDRR